MCATVVYEAGDVRTESVPGPKIIDPTGAGRQSGALQLGF